MRIFDSRWLGSHGIGRFATELRARLTGFEAITLRGKPSSPLDPWALSAYLRATAPTLFFSPGYNAPLASPCPYAFCVHDLNHLFVSENSSAFKRAYYQHMVRPAVRKAEVVLTVSDFSRQTICNWTGVDPAKVRNVGNGVSAAFTPSGAARQLDRPYFLYVGNHKPHKNFNRLLQAFAASGLPGELALVSTGAPTPELHEAIRRLGLGPHVSFVGCVSDDELAALCRGATALVLVSLFEGFGLPVLEAMSCGTAVLSSNIAPIQETAADAALLVDPFDVDAISDGMIRLASDPLLRRTLRSRGISRARSFSWDATVNKVREALHECA